MQVNHEGFSATVSGQEAVRALSEIMLTRIREKEKTKRLLIVVTFVLLAIAAFIPLFTPEGREANSYITSAVLAIMALGAIGATKFSIKTPAVEIESEVQQVVNMVNKVGTSYSESNNA
ncbi:hypothetical protein D3879_10010 [Pseudomonas cavernicola]|uniref:Uncharacterized protein n=1 Tax=Pseudomonas cavernicola TaxID=2320866 RepID=A0A418XM54_9PSED|nr:hypothetical protein [Pseudomonas cavernicola]RJG13550.1 hypothetical protein D3879_10010 [Pseudomonas cavernicola]